MDGFVLRYHPAGSTHVDGLPPGEGSFLPCSFWLVDCLCLMERQAEARVLFQRLLAVCSSLGLLSEEYDAKKQRQVGNLPQAFSHVGLINAVEVFQKVTEPPITEAGNERTPEPVSSKRASCNIGSQTLSRRFDWLRLGLILLNFALRPVPVLN